MENQEPKKSSIKEAGCVIIFLIILTIFLFIYEDYALKHQSHSSNNQSSTSSSSSASGMKSASSNIWQGTVLYNSDGSQFGTVTDFTEKHIFDDGSIDRAVQVDGLWYKRSFITETKYVK